VATSHSNTDGWALRLSRSAAAQLAGLRLTPGVEIAEAEDALWLRGRERSETLDRLLEMVPAEKRYAWLANDRLRPTGSRLASESLPPASWQPLLRWAAVRLPVARLPGAVVSTAALRLERGFTPEVANASLVEQAIWTEWAFTASALRLARLRVAASSDGRCLVLGLPPPAIPSLPLVERQGVIVPAGQVWRPRVTSKVIRRLVGATDDDYVLWDVAGLRLLSAELFVPASRAGARALLENQSR